MLGPPVRKKIPIKPIATQSAAQVQMPRENLRIAPPSDLQSLDRTPVARLGSTIPVFGAGKMTRHRKACHPRSIEREAKFGSAKSNRAGGGGRGAHGGKATPAHHSLSRFGGA